MSWTIIIQGSQTNMRREIVSDVCQQKTRKYEEYLMPFVWRRQTSKAAFERGKKLRHSDTSNGMVNHSETHYGEPKETICQMKSLRKLIALIKMQISQSTTLQSRSMPQWKGEDREKEKFRSKK